MQLITLRSISGKSPLYQATSHRVLSPSTIWSKSKEKCRLIRTEAHYGQIAAKCEIPQKRTNYKHPITMFMLIGVMETTTYLPIHINCRKHATRLFLNLTLRYIILSQSGWKICIYCTISRKYETFRSVSVSVDRRVKDLFSKILSEILLLFCHW